MDWFLYDRDLRHERTNEQKDFIYFSLCLCLHDCFEILLFVGYWLKIWRRSEIKTLDVLNVCKNNVILVTLLSTLKIFSILI